MDEELVMGTWRKSGFIVVESSYLVSALSILANNGIQRTCVAYLGDGWQISKLY